MIEPEDVRIEGFTTATYDFIRERVEEWYGHPMKDSSVASGVVPFESACALWFRLRVVRAERFPGGKWATLQHLQDQIEKAARP